MKAANTSVQPQHPTWAHHDQMMNPIVYEAGQYVHYKGYCYRALIAHMVGDQPLHDSPSDDPYWEQIMFVEHCPASQFPAPCTNAQHRVWRSYIAYTWGRCVHYDGFCWEATGTQIDGVAPGPLGWTKLAVVAESKSMPHPLLLPCDAPEPEWSNHPSWSKNTLYLSGHHVHKNGFCWEATRTHKGCNPTPTSHSWKATGYSHQGMVTNGCSDLLHPAWDTDMYYQAGLYVHYEGVCWRASAYSYAQPPSFSLAGYIWAAMTSGGPAAQKETAQGMSATTSVCYDTDHKAWQYNTITYEGSYAHHDGLCWRAKIETAMEPGLSSLSSWEVAATIGAASSEPWASSVCAEDHSIWNKQVKYASKLRVHHNLICWESTASSTGFAPTLHPFQNIWIPRASIQIAPWATAVSEQAPLLSLTIVSTCDTCQTPRHFLASSVVKQALGETWIVHQFRCDLCGSRYEFYSTNAPPSGVFSPHTGMPEFSQPTTHTSSGNPRLDALEF